MVHIIFDGPKYNIFHYIQYWKTENEHVGICNEVIKTLGTKANVKWCTYSLFNLYLQFYVKHFSVLVDGWMSCLNKCLHWNILAVQEFIKQQIHKDPGNIDIILTLRKKMYGIRILLMKYGIL